MDLTTCPGGDRNVRVGASVVKDSDLYRRRRFYDLALHLGHCLVACCI
jgi:hypothetical protein